MNKSKLFTFKNKLFNQYSKAQSWYQQSFLWRQEKLCSFDKARILLIKKDIWTMDNIFQSSKFILRSDFSKQWVCGKCENYLVETSFGKLMYFQIGLWLRKLQGIRDMLHIKKAEKSLSRLLFLFIF